MPIYFVSQKSLLAQSILHVYYLPKARSRIAGYFRLADKPSRIQRYTNNGAILIECYTLRHVVTSAAEAETKEVFYNAKILIPKKIVVTVHDLTSAESYCAYGYGKSKSRTWMHT